MLEKLRWAYRLLRSRAYVVMTDDEAGMNIPIVSLKSFSNIFLLAGQTAALHEFRERLDDLIADHEEAIQEIDGANTEEAGWATNVSEKRTKKPVRKSR